MTLRYQRNPDILVADMGGETVMMSVSSGQYFGLAGVAGIIWDKLAQPTTIDDLVSTICASHNIDEITCQADCEAFIAELVKQDMASGV